MKINFWSWFTETWESVIGNSIRKLTSRDGQDGLSWEDVRITAMLMKEAEVSFGTGEERRAWVLEQVKLLRKVVVPHLLELLFWTALNYAKARGWVKLG